MKILEPPISDAAVPFWDATRTREFVLPWCVACARGREPETATRHPPPTAAKPRRALPAMTAAPNAATGLGDGSVARGFGHI